MNSTSVSLLRRLREPQTDAAWQRFVELYAPLIYRWSLGQGLDSTDASDVTQEVLTVLVVRLPEFKQDPSKSFRAWLKTVTANKVRDFQRRATARKAVEHANDRSESPSNDTADLFEKTEYQRYLAGRALKLMQAEFQETTWRACWMHVVEEKPAAEIGRELGITPNAVHIARSRVLRRLREELAGLLD